MDLSLLKLNICGKILNKRMFAENVTVNVFLKSSLLMTQLVYYLRNVVPYSVNNEVITWVRIGNCIYLKKNKLLLVSFKYYFGSNSHMVDSDLRYDLTIQEPAKSQGRLHQKEAIAILIQIHISTFLFFHDTLMQSHNSLGLYAVASKSVSGRNTSFSNRVLLIKLYLSLSFTKLSEFFLFWQLTSQQMIKIE